MGTKKPETLLKNALWVTTWRDLPHQTSPAQYAGRARFGIYNLLDQVTRIEERGVAA